MIVIVIIGVVYTLVISKLQTFGEQKATPNFTNLKEYLLTYMKDADNVKLLCLNDCDKCSIYRDDKKIKEIKSFFDANVEIYRYDFLQGAVQKRKNVVFNKEDVEENVCFSLKVRKNSVADQVIVVYKNKAYDYSNYFSKVGVYDTLDDAVAEKQKLSQEIMQ